MSLQVILIVVAAVVFAALVTWTVVAMVRAPKPPTPPAPRPYRPTTDDLTPSQRIDREIQGRLRL